jgi:hypothetical protein
MDKLSNILPFIIFIGVIIYSIMKSSGKKQQDEWSKTTLPGHRSGKEITLPDILQEVQSTKKQKKTNRLPQPERIQNLSATPVQSVVPLEIEDLESSGETVLDISDVENIKKAVIYTEIFNRREL